MLLFHFAFNGMSKSATACTGELSKLCSSSWFSSQFRTQTFRSRNELQSEFHPACTGQPQRFTCWKLSRKSCWSSGWQKSTMSFPRSSYFSGNCERLSQLIWQADSVINLSLDR